MNSNPDHALVERCKKGERQALEALIGEYEKPVYNAAYRILGNRDDAADVTQAAFLKVFENLERYDPQYRFFSWIYRITINEAINLHNRNRRQQPLENVEPAVEQGPASAAEADDLGREIQAALMTLNEDYRIVMVLRHFSDCSYRQIGEILGIPEKTVKSRLYSARQLLKEQLVAHGVHH